MNELDDALAAYWDAAFSEGQRNATHDTDDGRAQRALDAVRSCVRLVVLKERLRAVGVARDWGATHEAHITVNARNAAAKIARAIEGSVLEIKEETP